MKSIRQYSLPGALRPFSLVVAIISCSMGILIAWQHGYTNPVLAFWILLGGISAQAGINLINDIEDLKDLPRTHPDAYSAQTLILRNLKVGLLCILLAVLISIYFVILRGWILLFIIVFSTITALSYNMGPVNFKSRGLAMLQVFLLMGVIMVQGAYFTMTGQFSTQALLHSIPISLLISLLLLSNELRDWEIDRQKGIGTFTVRAGFKNACRLYWLLIIFSYSLSIIFFFSGQLQQILWLLLPLPMLIPISRYLHSSDRTPLTPYTGRFFFIFGIAYLLAISNQKLLA